MERRHHVPALFHQDRVALIAGQDARLRSHTADHGRTDEHGFHFPGIRAGGEFGLGSHLGNAAIELAAVSVAFDVDIHQAEALLQRFGDTGGQQDGPGAGAKDRTAAAERGERTKEILSVQQLQHGSAFPAGYDQAIDGIEIGGGPHEYRLCAEARERAAVGFKIALQGQNADPHAAATSLASASIRLPGFWKFRGRALPCLALHWLPAASWGPCNMWLRERWRGRALRGRRT